MNVSSIVVQVLPKHLEEVIAILKESELCDYHLHDEIGRIIITIEGEDVGEETAKLQAIQKYPHIISAEMQFAYSEDELDKAREKLDTSAPMPNWLNDPNVDPNSIKYNGDLRGKF